jgi:hypothetical protein
MVDLNTEIRLGDLARDSITGFEGIVVAITDWLHGCRRITLTPQALHEGKPIDNQTFDEPQCRLVKPDAAVRTMPRVRTGGPHGADPGRRSEPRR